MPWGMDFGFGNPDYSGFQDQQFQFPAQSGYQAELPNFAPLMQSQGTPALSRYQNYLQSTPTREDNQGNWLTKLLASISGASAGYKNPAAGIQTAMGIMDIPYQRAVEQYKLEEPGLRNAAIMEERALNDKTAYMKILQDARNTAAQRAWDAQKFGMTYGLDQREFGLNQDKFRHEQQQDALDNAYNAGKLSVDQYQAQTARLNATANQEQSAAAAALSRARVEWGPQGNGPGFGEKQFQMMQVIASNPVLSPFIDEEGNFREDQVAEDPNAWSIYQQMLRDIELMPSLDIGLR